MTKLSIFAAVLSCACAGTIAGAQQFPVITTATINAPANQITITGLNLAPATGTPAVGLGYAELTVVSASASQIVATLPASLAPGSYQLKVLVGTLVARFAVAYGAQGPPGPAGPQGPQGPPGTLTLPFAGQASWEGPVFTINQLLGGYPAILGVGGPPDSLGLAGIGLAGVGGQATDPGQVGGEGMAAHGGDANATSALPGVGIYAGGGNATTGGQFGGNGIFAVAGIGPTDNLTYGLSGAFLGPVYVNGNLAKAGGSFVIDHPADPEHKYLYHSFVESPDMKNIYDGNVVTDGSGTAAVKMPEWFEALNRDFRYQLTVIGQPSQAWVASEIANGSFVIRTEKPNVKVSWQVTGIRQDAWANAHRIPLEVEKAAGDQGHYLHPELYGHSGEPDIHELHHPRPLKKQP
jgi:hypothetical protein